MNNDIAKDAEYLIKFWGVLRRDEAVPRLETIQRATAADKERMANLERKLSVLPADWSEDSSLETWFPMTADEVKSLRAQLAEKTQECEGLRGIMDQWRSFLKDVETAEDRSNLDGDDAETVLLQLNESAEAMLALEARKEGE